MPICTYMYHWNVQQKHPLCAASCVTKNVSPRFSRTISYCDANSVILQAHLCITVASMRKQTVVEIVHEESFLHAEPVKPPLHLRLPAAVAELAVYVFREHHAGAVLLFCVPTLPFLARFGTVVYRIPTLRKETYGTFLIGQSTPFLIHPSPN